MVRIPRPIDEYTPEELEQLELASRLVNSQGFKAIAELVLSAREQYLTNFARGLASSSNPVDQREVDFKRGFWQGAVWAVRTLPKAKAGEWKQLAESTIEEGENPG